MAHRRGFTLVELLVVFGILAILLTIVILAINIPKQLIAARDLQRKMDVKQLADSLASYYTEQKNIPPQDLWYSLACGNDGIPQALQPFMSSFLCDPSSKDHYYYETLDIDCQPCNDVICHKFRILTTLENPQDKSIPVVGCDSEVGCGPYSQTGQAYNYGASLGCPLKTDSLAWQTSQTAFLQDSVPDSGKILEVQLAYDEDSHPQLSLVSLTQKNGYPHPPATSNPEYKIVFLDAAGLPIYNADFSASHPELGFEITDDMSPVTQISLALTLPWYGQIASVRIEDQSGNLIVLAPASDITIQNNTPSFFTISGSAVIPKDSPKLNFNFVTPAKAQTTDDRINFVFIGDGFTTQSSLITYHQKITEFTRELLRYEPFASRASDFNFHYVDTTQNFNCYGHPNFYNCMGSVISAVNSAGVPWDNIYIIVNTNSYGGAAYYDDIAYGSTCVLGPQIYVHELAHSFGKLTDEYLASNSYEKTDRNCYQGTPPNPAWTGIVSPQDYYLGCNYSNWYRSSDNSLMRTLEARYFNPISQKYISDEINSYTGTYVIPTLIPAPTSTPTPSNLPDELNCYCLDNSTQTKCVSISCSSSSQITSACTAICGSHAGMKAGDCTENAPTCTGITPTIIPTPTPNPCIQGYTASLAHPILEGQGGQTVAQSLTITNHNAASCGSAVFGISYSVPSVFTLLDMPPSITLSGGQSQTINFSYLFSPSAAVGDHVSQIWINSGGSPYNTTLRVTDTAPTSVPTPTPATCDQNATVSVSPTMLEGLAGQFKSQILTMHNNNPASCGSANFRILYGGTNVVGALNPISSISLSGGESKNVNVTYIISSSAAVGDYTAYIFTHIGNSNLTTNSSYASTTIRVTGPAPTLTPTPTPSLDMFSNLSARMYGDYVLFKFSYAGWGLGDFRVDVATNQSALNQTVGPNDAARYGFTFGSGTPMDPSNSATPTSIRSVIQRTPQGWPKWTCGTTIYWRLYNTANLNIKSPVQSGTVDCTTQIDILPWDPWYQAIYYGVYDARYDPDQNGVVNWYDYWILVDQTRLR